MTLLATLVVLAALALGCHGADPGRPGERILCLGDSITAGVTHSSTPETPMRTDPLGGYPGRLARRLDDQVTVINRGVGGASTALWLIDPRTGEGRKLWPALRSLWRDLTPAAPPPEATSLADAVFRADAPDTIIILLGVNDLTTEELGRGAEVADVVVGRLSTIRRQAQAVARAALVATVLPNQRDPADLRERLNARIRTVHPDYLPLGERFAAAGWERLLGDAIHPNEEGYEVLAGIVADELVRRRLVAPAASTTAIQRPAAPIPMTTLGSR